MKVNILAHTLFSEASPLITCLDVRQFQTLQTFLNTYSPVAVFTLLQASKSTVDGPALATFNLTTTQELGSMIPNVQMRKLRLREVCNLPKITQN